MTQGTVNKSFPSHDHMIPRNAVIAALEEPANEMADNADIALDYITAILMKLRKEGHLSREKVNAATRILGGVADAAAALRNATYELMEAPAIIETQPSSVSEAVKTLSEELRIDWALSTLSEDGGRDDPIETRQRDRVQSALKTLEALAEGGCPMTANLPALQKTTKAAPFIHPVASDSMSPTYRSGQNSVICLPVEGYMCEGVYLVDSELYRCERTGRNVHVWRDNPAMPDYTVDVDVFNSSELALVVADITVRNVIGRDIMASVA